MMYDDDLFANRIAIPLRAPEPADPAFAERVLAAVYEGGRIARSPMTTGGHPATPTFEVQEALRRAGRMPPWWRRSAMVRVTPVRALVFAATIAGVVALGNFVMWRTLSHHVSASPSQSQLATSVTRSNVGVQHDTTYIVRFMLVAPSASSVTLVGDFNHWNRHATRLASVGRRGVWTVSVPLPPGQHEYAFIVDDTRWTADPHAALGVADDFGTESSIVSVGTRPTPPAT